MLPGASRHKNLLAFSMNKKRGRPKHIPLDLQDRDMPENYPTLLKYLEATGRVKHTTRAQMFRARHLFLRGVNSVKIANELMLDPACIDRWALIFGWEEERDRRLFEQFRRFTGGGSKYGANLGERHDRIAGNIEQVAERILHQHQNGELNLSPRDLSVVASIIKTTQEIRRTARNENISKKEAEVTVNFNMPQAAERLSAALVDAYNEPKPTLSYTKKKQITVEIGDAIGTDEEYDQES